MAIYFKTSNPSGLLAQFKAQIDAGHVKFWKVDAEGDLIHTAPGWEKKAYLRPVIMSGQLKLNVGYFDSDPGTRGVFGVISGRIIEMFISHVDRFFAGGSFTEDPMDGDTVLKG